jgi:hypothetical protein
MDGYFMKIKALASLLLTFIMIFNMTIFSFAASAPETIGVSLSEYGVRITFEEATQLLGRTARTNGMLPLSCGYVSVVTFDVFITSTGEKEVVARNPHVSPHNIIFNDSIMTIQAFGFHNGVDWLITNTASSALLFITADIALWRNTMVLDFNTYWADIHPNQRFRMPLWGTAWTRGVLHLRSHPSLPQFTVFP